MTDETTNTWQEIKNGLGSFFKIAVYSVIGLGFLFALGYAYFACFK